MDFILETVVEILGELLIESGTQAASSRRLPRWARVLILIVLGLLFLAVLLLLLLLSDEDCAASELAAGSVAATSIIVSLR